MECLKNKWGGLGCPGQFTSREITAELRSVDGSETRPYTFNVPVPTRQVLFLALIEQSAAFIILVHEILWQSETG